MTMTLEPCPFCGSADVEAYPADREHTRWNVCCGNPGCVTRCDNDYLLQSDAVAAWNRRSHLTQPAQSVGVEKVRRVIEEIAEQWHGCMYDAPGETVDISDAIRRAGTRLITAALQEKGNG